MRLIAFLLIGGVLSGCTFSRAIVNAHVRDLDTTWIELGRTTRADVIARLGLPPVSHDGGGIGKNSLRWVCGDTFTGTLEAGYIVTPTFEKGRAHWAHDLLILFDDADVVSLVSRTASGDGNEVRVLEWREVRK